LNNIKSVPQLRYKAGVSCPVVPNKKKPRSLQVAFAHPKSFAWFTHRMSEGEGAGRDFSPGSSSSKTSRCSRDSSESPSSSLAPDSAAGSEIEPAVEAGPVAGRPTRRGIRDLFLFVSSLLEAEGLVGVEVVGVLVE